tara:strand:- start:172 stop:354 length:183 start_codon:yes stop_codon:yes gene_type:complete
MTKIMILKFGVSFISSPKTPSTIAIAILSRIPEAINLPKLNFLINAIKLPVSMKLLYLQA